MLAYLLFCRGPGVFRLCLKSLCPSVSKESVSVSVLNVRVRPCLICVTCGSKTTHIPQFNKMLISKKCQFYVNLYPKKINLYQFTPNSCQFMLIYRRFFITYFAHAPHIDIPTPIFNLKTRICPQNQKKNLKIPNFPQICLISITTYVNMGNSKSGLQQRNIANIIYKQKCIF